MTLEGYLERHAVGSPQKAAVICCGKTLTYSELWTGVQRRARELQAAGVGNGVPFVFRSSQDPDFLFTYLAVHLAGGIAVPLEKDIPQQRFLEIEGCVEGEHFPEDAADVLFTTGTTGQSKGVIISHKTILADAENLMLAQGFSSEHVFIITGPLNHIGSLSKLYPVLLTGGTVYILEGMKDLDAFYTALDYPCEKMATFLVPTNIRTLLTFSEERLSTYAHKLDFVETGAAPMPHSDMLELCRVLPNTRLFNTYASTETGIIATYNYNDGECIPGCLGAPMKHSAIRIEDGRICCLGHTLMCGYVGDEALTQQVLRDEVIYTADAGYLDEKGRLHLEGRMDDTINIGGYKISPFEVEEVALSMPEIKDCICIAATHPVVGCQVLKLLVVMKEGHEFNQRLIARFLKDQLEKYKLPALYEATPAIHRTYNGKLDRKFYRC